MFSAINTLRHLVTHPLNQSNKASAIVRFFRWQVGSRVVVGDVIFDWVEGSKFVVRPGESGITGNVYCGLHEFQDMSFLLHCLRSEDVFVDVGANVGSYTILAGAVVGCLVYCFEPVPSTFSKLQTNIRLNDIEMRVNAFNIALGDVEGEIYFTDNLNCTNHALAADQSQADSIEVKVSTLDTVLKEPPFLIKLDIEGYEFLALKGADKTLASREVCAVIMELNASGERYGFDENIICSMMLQHGFDPYNYDPFERKLTNMDHTCNSSGNTIFIRDFERVAARVLNARKIIVNGQAL